MSAGRLLLAPGHLGEPRDLSLRVIEALPTADLVLLERGSGHGFRHILKRLDLPERPTLELPDMGMDEATSGAILGMLDRGGTCLLFGVDEGIPAYADPGGEVVLLVRRQRPAVPIRSLGGSSVVGAALLASGLVVDRFTVLGVTTSQQREAKLRETLAWCERRAGQHHAVVVLTTGADALELARRLQGHDGLRARMITCAALTRPEERVIDGPPEALIAAPLPDRAPCVVLLLCTFDHRKPTTWWRSLRRLWT